MKLETTYTDTIISSRVILNEKISKRMLWTIIFALTGVLLISYGSSQDKSTSIYGDLCAVGCAASINEDSLSFLIN